MTVWAVSRHAGARDWLRTQGYGEAKHTVALDVDDVSEEDVVVGTLPIQLAAKVCASGARYLHLTMDVPEELRGRELSAEEMERCGARLEPFHVERLRRESDA